MKTEFDLLSKQQEKQGIVYKSNIFMASLPTIVYTTLFIVCLTVIIAIVKNVTQIECSVEMLFYVVVFLCLTCFTFYYSYTFRQLTVTNKGIQISWLTNFSKEFFCWNEIERVEFCKFILIRLKKRKLISKSIWCYSSGKSAASPQDGMLIRNEHDLVKYINKKIAAAKADSQEL